MTATRGEGLTAFLRLIFQPGPARDAVFPLPDDDLAVTLRRFEGAMRDRGYFAFGWYGETDTDWEYYERALSPDRFAIAQELFTRIERATAEQGLLLTPVFRRRYLAFQRSGGYGVIGIELYREKPVEFWIKLPVSPDELRGLGQDFQDPYPELSAHWDAHNRQWEWEVPAMSDLPDVRPAMDLTMRYQPEAGSMQIPQA